MHTIIISTNASISCKQLQPWVAADSVSLNMPSRNTSEQGSRSHATEIYKCDANTHSRRNSRAGKANKVPKGTGQCSVAAGSNPASTLLHYATNSDFAPKPHRPTRPNTILSAPPIAAAAMTIPQWLLCQTSATISQLQCKQAHRHYIQSNATRGDAVPSDAIRRKPKL